MAVVALQLLIVSCCLLMLSGCSEGRDLSQAVYQAKAPSSSQCGYYEDDEQLMETLKSVQQQLCNPPHACIDILRCNSSASSGYYQIQAANGSALQVYCDMEGTHCGGKGGWMRVALLNMIQPSSQCPVGFRVKTANNKRFCIRDTSSAGCGSMLFESFGLHYSKVCGYVRAYTFESPDGFAVHGVRSSNEPLSGNYVDGVSITYGTPPTHIWTYVAGHQEAQHSQSNCPCNVPPGRNPPSYVGSDYYCESGTPTLQPTAMWYTSDPLWDGMQCGGHEAPCCVSASMPWFTKNTTTTATINIRLCLDEDTNNENIGIERLELYIK